jgi:DNA-binding response OmpR family regulator
VNSGTRPFDPPLRCGSILVVDDESASGELVATLLRSQGYVVRVSRDGREAIDLVARGGVDLLVLDLMMAKLDGVEVCAHVRNVLHELSLPIVIMTSLHDRESRLRAKEAGADDVFVKPIDGLELLVRVESLLRARAHVLELERERDAAREELSRAEVQLHLQQHMQHTLEGVRPAIQQLLARQHQVVEYVWNRWGQASEARELREQLAVLAQTSTELERCIESVAGPSAGPGTIIRVREGADGASTASESCGNPRSASK